MIANACFARLGMELPPMDNSFPAWLKSVRIRRGLSKRALEGKTGVSNGMLTMLENGSRNPSREMVARLASGLEVDENEALLSAGFVPQSEEKVETVRLSNGSILKIMWQDNDPATPPNFDDALRVLQVLSKGKAANE